MLRNKVAKELEVLKTDVKEGFTVVKKEMDNYLDEINMNNDEVQSLFDYLSEIDAKLNKLSERMDQMEMVTSPYTEPLACEAKLNKREQEIFMILYTANDKLTAGEIARMLGFSEEMVINYLYNLIAKGVPVVKECVNGDMFLSLNSRFKDLQAKKDILNINSKQLFVDH